MNAQHRQQRQQRGCAWRRSGLTAAIVLGMLAFGLGLRAVPVAADTWGPQSPPACPTATYTVPAGTRFVEVVAIGGAGRGGWTFNDNNTGGPGGAGAKVTAHLPVTPGQQLKVAVAHNGDHEDPRAGFPNGGGTLFPSGKGGGSSVVTTADGDPCLGASAQRSAILVLAGGGGGGGGAGTFGSGGAGGNAGANADRSGQAGSRAYGLSTDTANGHGGAGGTVAAAGGGGGGGCALPLWCGNAGRAGTGFTGGEGRPFIYDDDGGEGAGGAGGGGYYGGGGGGAGNSLGGGGGGAGSSYITPTNYSTSISQDTTLKPSVTITPLSAPTTTATLSGTTSGNNWYTSALTVTLTTQAGTFGLGKTYFALNDPGCSAANVHTLARCTEYKAPLTISGGVHTLTYFSVDTVGLDEAVQTKSFAVTVTTAAVSGASIGSGTNPTASGGGISVSSTGSGVVGTAVYGSNPAGALTFNSSGAYVDVIAAGSGLTSLTITNCHLKGGTDVYWWNGMAWARASNQTYNATTKCVTITVNSTTSPSLSQLTGTVFAAGSPPTTTAVAKTGDKTYTAGVWTNQSVIVTFTCSPNATATAPVTIAGDGRGQTADGTCTDGIGQAKTTTFTGINVDKTPPTCSILVSPTILRPPNSKLVPITGTATVGDNSSGSGVASVVGGSVTANEALASGDVQGFAINTAFSEPLTFSAVVNIAGQLNAKHDPSGSASGRTYSQTVTVTDHAGNTNATPCTWTVTVPRDERPRR